MSAVHTLQVPPGEEAVRALRAGDMVHLNGEIVISAGMPTFQRMLELTEAGRPLPLDLAGAALFHLGSYSRDAGGKFEVLYMNPTTSTRFNAFMPKLIRAHRLRMVGGKGGLDAESTRAMQETGCVYLSFLGGGATLHSQSIQDVVSVHWEDLIPHYRLAVLRVQNLGPLTVAIDSHGNSLYDKLQDEARARLPDILRQLDRDRAAKP